MMRDREEEIVFAALNDVETPAYDILGAVTAARRERPAKRRPVRTVLLAAALAAAMIVTVSAAALLGVFDRLKKQDSFALLGMTEVYEEYAYEVGRSAATERGDVFTLEKAAIDGAFCTLFYSFRYAEPVMSQAEFDARDDNSPWPAYPWAPELNIMQNGAAISSEGYQNSFEVQHYLADPSTVYGAWRCLLTPDLPVLEDGSELDLTGRTWDKEADAWHSFSLTLPVHLCQAKTNDLSTTYSRYLGGRMMTAQITSLHRSPLGNLLTLRYENNQDSGLGLSTSFVLRDQDTGEYIPFARIWTRSNSGGTGVVVDTFELFGDIDDLKTLELIPIWHPSSTSTKTVVPLSDLPCTDPAVTCGGYAPASYQVAEDNRIIVEMKPIGAATTEYSTYLNGVYFLDKDGNEVFHSTFTEKFKDRATGTITVVTTVEDPEDFAANVDKVAALWYFTHDYTLLEKQAVTIPLGDGPGAAPR